MVAAIQNGGRKEHNIYDVRLLDRTYSPEKNNSQLNRFKFQIFLDSF